MRDKISLKIIFLKIDIQTPFALVTKQKLQTFVYKRKL